MKGVRIDPGMFYPHYSTASAAVKGTLDDLERWGANTAFVFAVSPIYGPYYQTTHPNLGKSTRIPGPSSYLRTENFLPKFVAAAKARGIGVVASYRMNQYQRLAEANPTWVSRDANGPYRTEIYGPANWLTPLSAHVGAYRNWFRDMLRDAVTRMPDLAGLDACEGNVAEAAEEGARMPDRRLVTPTVGTPAWRRARADAMTELHEILFNVAAGRQTHVVHDLAVLGTSGALMPSSAYAAGCGFDWDAVVGLGYSHPCLSAIWQQREGERPGSFTPAWTGVAAEAFGDRYPGRTLLTHVEVTPFAGVKPTPDQFAAALTQALVHSSGVTVYSYDQLKKLQNGHYVDSPYGTKLAHVFATS